MELTNLSYIKAKDHYNSSLQVKKAAVNRLSNGNRLNMPGVDAGDTFTLSTSVPQRDSLVNTEIVPNVSPFSIESSTNFRTKMLPQNGAERSRINEAYQNFGEYFADGEQALSRILEADTAKEATRLAKSSIEVGLATQIMSSASRLTDLITPLTSEANFLVPLYNYIF
jgi:hypothetical protein